MTTKTNKKRNSKEVETCDNGFNPTAQCEDCTHRYNCSADYTDLTKPCVKYESHDAKVRRHGYEQAILEVLEILSAYTGIEHIRADIEYLLKKE